MRLRNTVFLTLFFFAPPLVESATLKGKIVLNEIGGQPVAGVAVTADGANSTVSLLPFGTFVLKFPNKRPGERVTLTIVKSGMVIVNWWELNAVLPLDPGANIVTLIVARPKDQEEMAGRFLRLKSLVALQAKYAVVLEERDRLLLELEKVRASLIAADLAKLKPGQTSQPQQQAMQLISEGKIDDAITTLVPHSVVEEIKKSLERMPLQLTTSERAGVIIGSASMRPSRVLIGFYEQASIQVAVYGETTNQVDMFIVINFLVNRQHTSDPQDWHLPTREQQQVYADTVASVIEKGLGNVCTRVESTKLQDGVAYRCAPTSSPRK